MYFLPTWSFSFHAAPFSSLLSNSGAASPTLRSTFDGSSARQADTYRTAIRSKHYWYCEITKDSDKSVFGRIRQRGYEFQALPVPTGQSGGHSQDVVVVYYAASRR